MSERSRQTLTVSLVAALVTVVSVVGTWLVLGGMNWGRYSEMVEEDHRVLNDPQYGLVPKINQIYQWIKDDHAGGAR